MYISKNLLAGFRDSHVCLRTLQNMKKRFAVVCLFKAVLTQAWINSWPWHFTYNTLNLTSVLSWALCWHWSEHGAVSDHRNTVATWTDCSNLPTTFQSTLAARTFFRAAWFIRVPNHYVFPFVFAVTIRLTWKIHYIYSQFCYFQ